MRRVSALLLISVTLLASRPALAKKASIEWKAIKGAVNYELQIERNGKVVAKKITDDTSWSGELGFGAYSYQIRAIDKVKRPGAWSNPRALVIAPKPPELQYPVSGKKVTLYDAQAGFTLRWSAVEGATKYAVTVREGKKTVYKGTVEGTTLAMKSLEPAEYAWQVSAVIEASGRVPASLQGKTWESPASDKEDFVVERKELAKAEPVFPIGVIPPGKEGKIQFEWKKVDGAEAYQVEVQEVDSRVPAAVAAAKTKKFVTTDRSLTAVVPGEGIRIWKVRALANIDATKVPGAVGPESVAQFQVSRNADFFEGSGYVAVSSLISPHTFETLLPDRVLSANPIAVTFRLSGEYWFQPSFGIGAAVENTNFTLNRADHNRKTLELNARYRQKISRDKFAWFFAPKLGFELRDNFELTCVVSSLCTEQFSTIGTALGFDIRKQFSEKFSLGAKISYYVPLGISDASTEDPGVYAFTNGKILLRLDRSRVENWRNLSVGIQSLYWLAPRFGLGAGVFGELRSVAYKTENLYTRPDGRVRTDAVHLFTSLLYTFGK